MGWNTGWTIMEEQIMSLYELGSLSQPVLKAVLRPFVGTDVDEGGSSYPMSEDGKSFWQIVVEIMFPEYIPAGDPEDGDVYSDKFYELIGQDSID